MNRSKKERFIVLIVSLLCIGFAIESIIMKWEFWLLPIIFAGIFGMWVMYLTERPEYGIRKPVYFIITVLVIFIQGFHFNNFIDIAPVISLMFVAFSFLGHSYMMNVLLSEYVILAAFKLFFDVRMAGTIEPETIWGAVFQAVMAGLLYFACVESIEYRMEIDISLTEKDERIEAVDADMEDFLTNISHELRTPVNVVNGMSEMLLKKNAQEELYSIKGAGVRLAYQIEDIQDYTECKRGHIILEEEDYISTSVINDVVMAFRQYDIEKDLELIVDMDPNVPVKMRGDVKKLCKIFRHLISNAIKFTNRGGIYIKTYTENTYYGVNLCIEVTDTGKGMDRRTTSSVSNGMYQVDKKRNRSSGGIGLGLFIVHEFAHRMGGFVRIESQKGIGTTVRVTLPQKVVDSAPGLKLDREFNGDVLFHVRSDKYRVPRVRDFYRSMALNLAKEIRVPLYPAETMKDVRRLMKKLDVTVVFMGQEEYEANSSYFDELSRTDVMVVVSAGDKVVLGKDSRVFVMPKPLYTYPVMKVINEGYDVTDLTGSEDKERPSFYGIRALVVDDEPMNLVVAKGLFRDYGMQIDTAASGKDAINHFEANDYDVIFMDHMMPEMDGVEAMKQIRLYAERQNRSVKIIALTANAVSGAREMFIAEGFDGFISKPISIADFERVMLRELPESYGDTLVTI